jgi:hypothetical protein
MVERLAQRRLWANDGQMLFGFLPLIALPMNHSRGKRHQREWIGSEFIESDLDCEPPAENKIKLVKFMDMKIRTPVAW